MWVSDENDHTFWPLRVSFSWFTFCFFVLLGVLALLSARASSSDDAARSRARFFLAVTFVSLAFLRPPASRIKNMFNIIADLSVPRPIPTYVCWLVPLAWRQPVARFCLEFHLQNAPNPSPVVECACPPIHMFEWPIAPCRHRIPWRDWTDPGYLSISSFVPPPEWNLCLWQVFSWNRPLSHRWSSWVFGRVSPVHASMWNFAAIHWADAPNLRSANAKAIRTIVNNNNCGVQ